jgi:hypothetical protein
MQSLVGIAADCCETDDAVFAGQDQKSSDHQVN